MAQGQRSSFLLIKPLETGLATLLTNIAKVVGNYGVAIIILTIFVRLLLLPLTLKQEKSMKKMRDIQPELDKLKEKYKDKPQEFQKATAEIYKEHNVNPLAGCLPLLIQMPIFIALYYVFSGTSIPSTETFLWFNLKQPDKLFMFGTFAINLLPILNTVVTFVQQKMISNASKGQETNTTMQSMMYTMPVLMLVLFYNMPSGVTLYYLISGILSVAQQYFIMKGRN